MWQTFPQIKVINLWLVGFICLIFWGRAWFQIPSQSIQKKNLLLLMYSSSILSGKMATPLVLKSSTAFEKSTDWFLVAVEHRPLAPRARLVCAAALHITIILAHFTRFDPTLKDPVQKLSKCPNTGPGWQKEGAEQLVNKADFGIGMGRHQVIWPGSRFGRCTHFKSGNGLAS